MSCIFKLTGLDFKDSLTTRVWPSIVVEDGSRIQELGACECS